MDRSHRASAVEPNLKSKDLPPNTAPFFPNIYFNNQFRAKPVYPPGGTDLSGKVAIITGANSGLGLECSRQLLSYRLSRLIVAVRSREKGARAAAELQSGYPSARVEVWQLDMASYASVRDFAGRVEAELPRVDFVVLNAGVMKASWATVPGTGHEEMFQVNYLSQALLTFLLLPVLKSKAPPDSPARVTWVNSALSLAAKFPERKQAGRIFPALDDQKGFGAGERYNTSKTLAHFFLWKLSEYVRADDVIVTITDPGYVKGTQLVTEQNQDLERKYGCLSRLALRLFEKTARTLEIGTSTLVDAVVNHGKDAHGCLFMGWKVAP